MKKWEVAALVIALIAFLIAGSEWDVYVFIESTRMLCNGIDPYTRFHSIGAYIPSLGPMWIAYPPLVLLLWYPGICTLEMLKVPLSWPYLWAVKYIPALFALLSAYVLKKYYNKSYAVYLLPVVIVAVYLHGMFDSVTAFFLLLSTALLRKRKYALAGLSYGLALASKQHAILATFAFAIYLLKKGLRRTITFALTSIIGFVLVIVAYGLLVGNLAETIKDVMEVLLFHLNRPPNGLGFGGFSVISIYSDALNEYSGNIISALVFRGNASVLHGPVTRASIPFLITSILLVSVLFDLEVAILMSYAVYILFSYVGALQHLVVPAMFVPFLDKKERKLFITSTTLYSLSHVLAFWAIFPIIFEPLFLKQFGLSEALISRTADAIFPYWDVILRLSGLVLTSTALVTLIIFIAYMFNKATDKSYAFALVPIMYILELSLLAIMLSQLKVNLNFPEHFTGTKPVLVYAWENIEYPGYRFGDYLTTPYAIPKYGYYSMVKPLAMKLSEMAKKKNYEVLVVAREDLIRSYQVTDLISALEINGVKWAWAIPIARNDKKYTEGISGAPLNEIERLLSMVRHNIPLKGYATLPPLLNILNVTLIKLPPLDAYYPKCGGKPVVYVIPIGKLDGKTLNRITELAQKYGLCIKEINVKNIILWNVKPSALST